MSLPLLRLIACRLLALTLFLAIAEASPAHDAAFTGQRLDQFKRSVWGEDQGAPSNIHALAQSPDGFLWLGTTNGLYRFDGITFEQAYIEDGIARSVDIHTLYRSSSGLLFVGHDWGGISIVRNGVWMSAGPDAPKGTIARIVGDDHGRVWVFSAAGGQYQVQLWDGTKWADPRHNLHFDNYVGDMAASPDGTLWVASGNAVYRLPLGTDEPRRLPIKVDDDVRMGTDRHGNVWLVDSQGWRAIDARSGAVSPAYCAGIVPPASGQILFGRDDALWAFDGRGLFRVAAGPRQCAVDVRRADIHADEPPMSLAEDREGNIWVGTAGGLQQYRRSTIVPVPLPPARAESLATKDQWSPQIIADGKGALFLRAQGRMFALSADGRPEGVSVPVMKYSHHCAARDGGVWVRDRIDRLRLIGRARPSSVSLPPEWRRDDLRMNCLEDARGRLWAGVGGKGLFRHDQGRWRRFRIDRPVRPASPFTFVGDGAGNVYTYVGRSDIAEISGDSPRIVVDGKRLADDFVDIMQPTSIGLLIGAENGLLRLRDGRLQRLPADRFPMLRDISGIVERGDGTIWMIGDKGVVHLPARQLSSLFDGGGKAGDLSTLTAMDGLYGMPEVHGYPNMVEAADKRLWLTTALGLFWVDPSRPNGNGLAPPVIIKAISGAGFRLLPSAQMSLPKGTGRIQIDFTATSLTIPSRVRFRYRLQGVDEKWLDAGAARQASYTNLGPGDYRFTVIAANNSGVWNREGASIAFHIPPTFRQSLSFKLLILAAIVLLLWMAYAWRVRQIAASIRLRDAAQVAERERIARGLHDTLLQGFQGLMLRLQRVSNHIPPDLPASAMMEEALERGDQVLVEGRDQVHRLRAAADSVDIVAALRQTAHDALAGTELSVSFDVSGSGRLISAPVADEIVAIGGEALANAVRHAGAQAIAVTIRFDRRSLLVGIADDGSGMDDAIREAGARPGHFGLIGMYERAAQIRGTLDILNRVGGGVEIVLTIPGGIAFAVSPRKATPPE
jgi:signal transduction histidine kinase/ligand-binding sensor domain-containing protein